MPGAYLVGKYYLGDEEVGCLAALLVGWNWHIGWYAHRLLNDVMLAAFMVLTFGLSSALFIGRVDSEKVEYILTSLLGMSVALSVWAKESAFYLMPPLLLWMGFLLIYHKNKRFDAKKKMVLLSSFFAFFSPFSYVCLIRYGHPIYPLVRRICWYESLTGRSTFPPCFNTNVLLWPPFSLGVGLVCFILMLYGALRLYQNNKIFLPTWALYCYLFHVFFVPELPLSDQHMVHYTPLFLIMAAYGLKEVTEVFQDKRKFSPFLYLVLVFLAMFSTNLCGSPLVYSLRRGKIVFPISLHQRIAFEKFDKIWNVIQCAKVLVGYDWLSCFYKY